MNDTNGWQSFPSGGSEDWSNVSKVINHTYDCLVRWKFYTNDTAGNENVSEEYSFTTLTCNVEIGLSTTLANGISFGMLEPNNQIQAAPDNNGSGITNYSIIVYVSEGCNPNQIDLWTRVNDTLNKSSTVYIPYEQYYNRYNITDSTVPGTSYTPYSKTYQSIGSNLANETEVYLKFFLNVSNAEAGDYSTFTFFKANVSSGG